MTDRFDIQASEFGVVRVFEAVIDSAPVQREFLNGDRWRTFLVAESDGNPMSLDEAYVDLINPRDLQGVGLSQYLIDGVGIATDVLSEADAARLNQIHRPVVVLLSKAFANSAATLQVSAPLIWVGTYGEVRATPVQQESRDMGGHVPSQSAGASSERPTFLRVALFLGLIFAALLGVLMLFAVLKA